MCASLAAMGCDIVTGGGPGLMQAANEGAQEAQAASGGQSIGRSRSSVSTSGAGARRERRAFDA
jgi:predicted Rossmann-fold nucleotide-binding protein